MMLTPLPSVDGNVAEAMSSRSLAARSSMLLDGGTEPVMTVAPFCSRASWMPYQYWTAGRAVANLISENPRRPWASTMGCFGVSIPQCCAC